jgi:hypothetical protein
MVVVYSKRKDGPLEEIGRSEVTLNSLNPSWMTKISVQYQFEVLQPLVFQVFDIDPQLHDVSEKVTVVAILFTSIPFAFALSLLLLTVNHTQYY